MKKKITLITHYFEDHVGGVESAAHLIAENISDEFEITWFASRLTKNNRNNTKINYYSVPCFNFLEEYLGLPFPIWNPFSFIALWNNIKSSNMVHLHDYIYMGNIFGFIAANLQKKPILITQHIGMIPYKNPLFRILLSTLNKTLGKFILNHADKVVFSNNLAKDYFSKICSFKKPPSVVLNGVSNSMHFPDENNRKSIRKEFNLPENKLVFLFVGRFVEKKGLHIIKELIREFNDITWVLVGEGPINAKIWNYNNLILTGNCKREKLNKLYQTADLLILPSKGEGLPLCVQESMSCGTPCLISSETLESFPEIKDYVFNVQINGDLINSWSKKINELLNTNKIFEMRKELPTISSNYWGIESRKEKYITELNLLLNNP